MASTRLESYPSLDDIDEFRDLETNTIYIKSQIMKGLVGLLIESTWFVDYSNQSIRLLNSNLISQYEKIPLTPFDVPDRHLRSARKIGAALFNVKRFDRLILFEMKDPSTGFIVTRDDETRVFADSTDAKLYVIQRGEGGEVGTQALTKNTIREAQQNSAKIRTEMLRLLTQIMTGVGAMKRIKTLKKRGLDLSEIENIWCDAHDRDHIPAVLRSVLYE